MNNSIRQSIKYWYMQKDVDCFLHSFYYPYIRNIYPKQNGKYLSVKHL